MVRWFDFYYAYIFIGFFFMKLETNLYDREHHCAWFWKKQLLTMLESSIMSVEIRYTSKYLFESPIIKNFNKTVWIKTRWLWHQGDKKKHNSKNKTDAWLPNERLEKGKQQAIKHYTINQRMSYNLQRLL